MNNLSISNDIIPVGEFKAGLAKYLNEINSVRKQLIITQNGKPAGVLISPEEFDKMNYTNKFIESVLQGLSDSENGKTQTTSQVKKILEQRRSNRKK